MRRKQVPIAILVASITTLWMAASAVSAPFSKPVLPALPDLDDWVRVLEALEPPSGEPGDVAVGRPEQARALRGSYLDAAQTMANWSGDALVIESGVHTLESLATVAARPDLLRCQADGCELRAPLLVSPGAGLVIAGARERPLRLRLVQESGAYVVNTGRLHIAWAHILGWSSSTQAAAETDGARFRPFIVGFGASETVVLRSELHHLGFYGSKSYGFTLSSLTGAFPDQQPSARLFASRLHQLYRGLYTYEARSVAVVANVFSQSHEYGLDPHDATSDLLIARNEIYGTRGHGMVLSKDVYDSWIVDNISRDNEKSGLVIDASSNGIVVAGNRLIDNRQDGLAIFESHDSIVTRNQIEGNGEAGIRIRASAGTVLADNTITGNGTYGLTAYDWPDTTAPLTPEKAAARRPVSIILYGNRFADNANGACRFRSGAEAIAHADAAGALEPCGEAVPSPGEHVSDQGWRRIPDHPGVARLVVPGDGAER